MVARATLSRAEVLEELSLLNQENIGFRLAEDLVDTDLRGGRVGRVNGAKATITPPVVVKFVTHGRVVDRRNPRARRREFTGRVLASLRGAPRGTTRSLAFMGNAV